MVIASVFVVIKKQAKIMRKFVSLQSIGIITIKSEKTRVIIYSGRYKQ